MGKHTDQEDTATVNLEVKKKKVNKNNTSSTHAKVNGKKKSHMIPEPESQNSVTYGRTIMEDAMKKPETQLTPFEKMALSKEGISKKSLEQLKRKSALDYNQLAEILSASRATLINKKGNSKFGQDLSEKILELAAIYSYGYEVFEDEERFNRWIMHPIRALGGKAPYEFLNSRFGREEVVHIIGRIAYGVYS